MGKYIETHDGRIKNKAAYLCEYMSASQLDGPPESFNTVPQGQTLVCVVHNPRFEAAAIVDSQSEYDAFVDPNDPRKRAFLLVPTTVLVERGFL